MQVKQVIIALLHLEKVAVSWHSELLQFYWCNIVGQAILYPRQEKWRAIFTKQGCAWPGEVPASGDIPISLLSLSSVSEITHLLFEWSEQKYLQCQWYTLQPPVADDKGFACLGWAMRCKSHGLLWPGHCSFSWEFELHAARQLEIIPSLLICVL